MCRLTAYKGTPCLIGDLVTNPNNSLLLQSRDAAYHPGVIDRTHRRNILVNGDGFGVAWYSKTKNKGSCAFKFVTPAWSNSNLRSIGDHVESHLIFAHIRAASSGHDPNERVNVSQENCHPFKYNQFTFMHNGGIPHFSRIKLHLLNQLSTQFFHEIKGSTDSEHIFALFLTILYHNKSPSPPSSRCNSIHTHLSSFANKDDTFTDKAYSTPTDTHASLGSDSDHSPNIIKTSTSVNNFLPYHKIPHSEYIRKAPHDPNEDLEFTAEELAVALNMTIAAIIDICEICGVHEPCSINVCLTDGINIVATRFRNGTQNPPSLYYNYGSTFVCEDGIFYSKDADDPTKKPNSIIISSAPISRVEAYHPSISSNNLKHKAPIKSLAKSISGLNLCPNKSNSPVSKIHSHLTHEDDYGFIVEQELEELDEKSIDSDDSDLNNFGVHDQYDIGSWILMPKNHMLVCKADPDQPDYVKSVALHPIVLLKCKVDGIEQFEDEEEEEEELLREENFNSKSSSFSSISNKKKKKKTFDVTKTKCSASSRNEYLNIIRRERDKFAGSLQSLNKSNIKTKKFRSKPSKIN